MKLQGENFIKTDAVYNVVNYLCAEGGVTWAAY